MRGAYTPAASRPLRRSRRASTGSDMRALVSALLRLLGASLGKAASRALSRLP